RELSGFAEGLKQDEAAVQAALSLEWSNGQTEGQINRLKTLKRQMYGRAGFDLLRRRFLQAGGGDRRGCGGRRVVGVRAGGSRTDGVRVERSLDDPQWRRARAP